MELSPQSVANTSFKTVKKGYDPAEVRLYLENLSKSIENLQSQATAMEARARAAVARLQEIAAQPQPEQAPESVSEQVGEKAASAAPAESDRPAEPHIETNIEQSETISRTLLLAQRTADTTIAEASLEARRITGGAEEESRQTIGGAKEVANRLIEDAKRDARSSAEGERVRIDSEVQSLIARRDFLVSDVDHLELHIVAQRDRLRDVAIALTDIVSRAPDGLGDVRRPLISAAGRDEGSGSSSEETLEHAPADSGDSGDSGESGEGNDGGAESSGDTIDGGETSESTENVETAGPDTDGRDPGFDALGTGSAISESDSPVIAPMSTPEPVTLTPLDDREGDRQWPRHVEPDDSRSDPADDDEGTPPTGQPNRFLFEDITDEIARVPSEPTNEQTTTGDEQH